MGVETSILSWILADTTITSALDSEQVYWHRVPDEALLPWIVVSIRPMGRRDNITQSFTDVIVNIEVDCEHELPFAGRALAELVLRRLDNFRGDLTDIDDVHIRCKPPYPLDGYSGSYCYRVEGTVRYKEARTEPPAS